MTAPHCQGGRAEGRRPATGHHREAQRGALGTGPHVAAAVLRLTRAAAGGAAQQSSRTVRRWTASGGGARPCGSGLSCRITRRSRGRESATGATLGGSTATLAGATAGEGSLAAEDDALAESKGRVSQQGARSSRGPLSRAAACPSCCVAAAGQQHESFACPIDRQNTMEKPASAKEATKATRKPIDSHRLHPNRARTLRMRASGAGWGRGFVLTVGSLRAVGGDRT